MTGITTLYLGNRRSGKTKKLKEEISLNLLKDPNSKHIVFSRSLEKKDIKNINPHLGSIHIYNKYEVGFIRGTRDTYLYLDELDIAKKEKALELIYTIPLTTPKKIHVNTSPLYLRDKKDLNVNHVDSRDPLIKILQITDFEFQFLFNKKTASFYRRSFFKTNPELYYSEGLGLISLFD